jgi:hypothetical protein
MSQKDIKFLVVTFARKNKQIHWFYHSICSECGKFVFQNRCLSKDLTEKRGFVTRAKIKLGY